MQTITPELIESTAREVLLYFQQFNSKLTINVYKQLSFDTKSSLYQGYKLGNNREANRVIRWLVARGLDLVMLPYKK